MDFAWHQKVPRAMRNQRILIETIHQSIKALACLELGIYLKSFFSPNLAYIFLDGDHKSENDFPEPLDYCNHSTETLKLNMHLLSKFPNIQYFLFFFEHEALEALPTYWKYRLLQLDFVHHLEFIVAVAVFMSQVLIFQLVFLWILS